MHSRCLIFLLFILTAPAHAASEREYQKRFCAGWDLEVVTPNGTRADCESPRYAIEVEKSESWAEGIGQALHYAAALDKDAAIILVCEYPVGCTADSYRLELPIKKFNLPITVWYCMADDKTLSDCVMEPAK